MKKSKLFKLFGIHESWDDILGEWFEFNEGNLKYILSYLRTLEKKDIKFNPQKKDIFKAFRQPKDNVRIVWLLQDPYPDPRLANGIALAVPKGKLSPSLEAVIDELFNYKPIPIIDDLFDNTLQHWENQGIFMLNSALTCRSYAPKTHTEMWEPFISHVLTELNKESGRIYVLSGKVAQSFSKCVSEETNYLIKTYHPAADKHQIDDKKKLFLGNGIFKQIDDIIEEINGSEFKIKWLKDEVS